MPRKDVTKKVNYGLYVLVMALFLTSSLVIYTYLRLSNNFGIYSFSPKSLNLSDKNIIAQDNTYTAYVTKILKSEEGVDTSEIALYNKKTKAFTKIDGKFLITGAPSLISDDTKDSVAFTTGTFVTRNVSIISINDKKQTFSTCAVGEPYFYKESIIFQNCVKFNNRPWGKGEAPGIDTMDIQTGKVSTIFESSLLKHFSLTTVKDSTVFAKQISVATEVDWKNRGNQKVEDVKYKLSQ